MQRNHDAIVIGAGQNGLACACYLAAAGLSVLVLERYHTIGGMTLTEELTLPGFHSDVHASGYQLANISPVPGELGLAHRGVELIEPDIVYAHAFPDGRGIPVSRDLDRTIASISHYSKIDADACRSLFGHYRSEKSHIVDSLFTPPESFAATAKAMASTPGGMDEYRFALQSVRSWGNETFETEEIRSLFGAFGLFVGSAPDDAGGAEIAWLFGAVLQAEGNNFVKGGMHNVTLAMVNFLEEHGGAVRTSAEVDRIIVGDSGATGVRLSGGEEIVANRLVVSSTDPAQLVRRFLGADIVGGEIVAQLDRYEWGDATMVMYVALDAPVPYAAGEEFERAAHVHLTPPTIGEMAQAVNECRAGQLPARPLIVAWNDSIIDPSRAPEGKHLKKFVVLGVPYEITGDATGRVDIRDWDEAKAPYADHLLEMIETSYMPELRQHILKCEAHSPVDLERKLSSAVRGTIGHGAMLPYQKGSMRPIPELGGYRTPVANVYVCDSGCHPGAGVSMAAGRNAAQVIHTDLQLSFDATVTSARGATPAG
ncbi:MAG TPA: NAD(P)/FAD-dependent oxidoreductase [Thermomicrobiales bacterium]|nr:NAD(P)/FAD-dependent oxidoreductase [Thermomicrobiales bacterium]